MGKIVGRNDGDDGNDCYSFICLIAEVLAIFIEALQQCWRVKKRRGLHQCIMTFMPKVLNFKVIVEQDEDGWFIAGVPAIPGCHTQGKTYEEAVKNIGEAIGLCLEEAKENRDYRQQIVWPEEEKGPRFLGVIDLPVKVTFAT